MGNSQATDPDGGTVDRPSSETMTTDPTLPKVLCENEETEFDKSGHDLGTDVDFSHLFHGEDICLLASKLWDFKGPVHKRCYWKLKEALEGIHERDHVTINFSRFCDMMKSLDLTHVQLLQIFNLLDYEGRGSFEAETVLQALWRNKRITLNDDLNLVVKRFENCSWTPGLVDVYIDQKDSFRQQRLSILDFLVRNRLLASAVNCGVIKLFEVACELRERIVKSRINTLEFSDSEADLVSTASLKAQTKPVLKKEDSVSGDDLLPVEVKEPVHELQQDKMHSGNALALWSIQLITTTARACHTLAPEILNAAVTHTRAMVSHLLPLSLCHDSEERPSFLNEDCFHQMTSMIQLFPEKADLLELLLSFHLACGSVSEVLHCLTELNDSTVQIDWSKLLSNIDQARKGLLEKTTHYLKVDLLGCDVQGNQNPCSVLDTSWKQSAFSTKPGETKVNFVFECSTWAEIMKIKIKVDNDNSAPSYGFIFVLAEWPGDSSLKKELEKFSIYDNWSESDYKSQSSQRLIEKSCVTNEPVAYFSTKNRDEVDVVLDYPVIGKFVLVKFLEPRELGVDHLGIVGIKFYGIRITTGFSLLEMSRPLLDAKPLESNQLAIQMVLRFLLYVFCCQGKRKESVAEDTYHFSRTRYVTVDQKTGVLFHDSPPSNIYELSNVMAKMPFSKDCPYFEIEFFGGATTIGAVSRDFPMDGLPGLTIVPSYGYDADQGRLFGDNDFMAGDMRWPCTSGDKLGCGVEFEDEKIQNVYFTRNGERIFTRENVAHPPGGLFPQVGMHYFGEKVRLLSKKPWRFGAKAAEEVAAAGDFLNPNHLDLSNVTIESLWKAYKTFSEKMNQGLILQLIHSMLPLLKNSSNNYKNASEIFDHLSYLLDCKNESEEEDDILTRNARDIIKDGLNIFFPCKEDRPQMLLDLLENFSELSSTGSKMAVFQSLCQYFCTVDLNALMPLPTTPSQLPQDFNSSNVCTLMEKLLSISFHDSLGLFKLTPGTEDSAAIHKSVSLGDQVLSGRNKSEHLLHVSKLFNQLQVRLLIWVCQQLSKSSPEATDDVDRLEKLIIHHCCQLIAPKAEQFLTRMKMLKDSDLRVLLSQLDTSFLATTLRELVLLLCELSTKLSPWLNVKLLETLKPVLITIRKLLFKVPDLLPSLDENQGEKLKETELKSWEIDMLEKSRTDRFVVTFSCVGATHFEVEFDKRCELGEFKELLDFTDGRDQQRFNGQVGSSNWPMNVRFEDTSAINFSYTELVDTLKIDGGYKFKVKALQTKIRDFHWLYDLYLSFCRLFGRISGHVLDKTPVLQKSMNSEDNLETEMYESELWTTTFRGGLVHEKTFERSLSGNYETEDQSDVGAFLNAVAELKSEKAKTFINRCKSHHHCNSDIGGEEIDRVIASVFAALLWHTQSLRHDVSIYLRNEFDGKISVGIHEAYAAAESLRLFLTEKRQSMREELEEEHEREEEEEEKERVAVIDVVHLVEEKSKFLLQFACLSRVTLKAEESKRKFESTRSRQQSVNRRLSHEPSIDLSISVESKYPSFRLVFDFVQDMAWTKDKVEDLLRKRYLKAESLWKTYSFVNEFFLTICSERLENDPSFIAFVLSASQATFGRHYADGIDGCGLGMEANVRSSYYGLLRNLVTILRENIMASSDKSKPVELQVLATSAIHLLDIDWQAYDLPFVTELRLPELYFTLAKDYRPSVLEADPKEFGVDETGEEYSRIIEMAGEACRNFENFCRNRCDEEDAWLAKHVAARFKKLGLEFYSACDGCRNSVSTDDYYRCLDCRDLNICKTCFENEYIPDSQTHNGQHGLILFRYLCKGCMGFITGTRWRCSECDDFDLCNCCHNINELPEFCQYAELDLLMDLRKIYGHNSDHTMSKFPTPKVHQKKKSMFKDPMDAYFHLHSWMLFSSVALSALDFLISKASEERVKQKADEGYTVSAQQLYSLCLDMAVDYLIRESSTNEVDSGHLISPCEAEATDTQTGGCSVETSSVLSDESLVSKVIGLIAALIPSSYQNPVLKEATELLSSEKFLMALFNIARLEKVHGVITRSMALGLLGKLLQQMNISSEASQSLESSESGEMMIVDPLAVHLVQSLFSFGAHCLLRHDWELAKSTSRVLIALQSNPTWTRLLAHHFSATVDLLQLSPSMSSIFALFALTGFPEMLSVGTLVTHLEKDKDVVRSVVRQKEPDYGDSCVVVELASRKKSKVLNVLLDVVGNDKSFLTENQVLQAIRLIIDVVNQKFIPGLTLDAQSLCQLALLIKASLQSAHLSQSSKVKEQLYEKSFIHCLSHLASLGTGLSKNLLLRDLEILSLELNTRSQTEPDLTAEPEEAFATTAEEDVRRPVASSSIEDGEDDESTKSEEMGLMMFMTEAQACIAKVAVIVTREARRTEKKRRRAHKKGDIDTGVGMGRYIFHLLNAEIEIDECIEEANPEKPCLLSTNGDEEDKDAMRKRKEKSLVLVEQLFRSKDNGLLTKVNRALAILYARQLVMALLSECPEDKIMEFCTAGGPPECRDIVSTVILLLLVSPGADTRLEKIIANLISRCQPDDIVSIAIASSFFVAAAEGQVVTVLKQLPPPPSLPESSSSNFMDEVFIPGATTLKVELDKRSCVPSDVELVFSSSPDLTKNRQCFSGRSSENWQDFTIKGDHLYCTLTGPDLTTLSSTYQFKVTGIMSFNDHFDAAYFILNTILDKLETVRMLPVGRLWKLLVVVANRSAKALRLRVIGLLLKLVSLQTKSRGCEELSVDLSLLKGLWQMYRKMTEVTKGSTEVQPALVLALTELFYVAEKVAKEWNVDHHFMASVATVGVAVQE